MDPYKILGIKKNASKEDIEKAYRKLCKVNHPDLNPGDPEAEERFKKVQSAYEELTKKKPDFLFNPFDFFGFGNQRGQDIQIIHTLTFEEAALGCTTNCQINDKFTCTTCTGLGFSKEKQKACTHCRGSGMVSLRHGNIHISRTCEICSGYGFVAVTKCHKCHGAGFVEKPRIIQVTVPEGTRHNDYIGLRGQGQKIPNGTPGDVLINIQITPDINYTRLGDDLHMSVAVPISLGFTGGTLTIQRFHEDIVVTIPARCNEKAKIMLDAKGLVNPETGVRGNLIVNPYLVWDEISEKLFNQLNH